MEENGTVQAVVQALDALEGAVVQLQSSKPVVHQILHSAKQRCKELQQVGDALQGRL
jgi:hypothetical protein